MKNLTELDQYRVDAFGNGDLGDEYNGAFKIKIKGEQYFVIASNGMGWEHVSISHTDKHKIASWKTMCMLKDMFFDSEEVVMQLHPKKSEYINNAHNCLHLWKPINVDIPTPPSILVGVK